MKYLTKRIGSFPLGIWIVLFFVIITGGLFILCGQALSFFAWDVAHSLGFQEYSTKSSDIVERTIAGMSWGEACADTFVQGTLVILTLVGIFRRRRFAFITGISLAVLWIYYTFLIPGARIGLYNWGVASDLSQAKLMGLIFILLCGIPGIISIICLVANRQFFEADK
jgi:hypothetical protein